MRTEYNAKKISIRGDLFINWKRIRRFGRVEINTTGSAGTRKKKITLSITHLFVPTII